MFLLHKVSLNKIYDCWNIFVINRDFFFVNLSGQLNDGIFVITGGVY